jgi:hypothetical protein
MDGTPPRSSRSGRGATDGRHGPASPSATQPGDPEPERARACGIPAVARDEADPLDRQRRRGHGQRVDARIRLVARERHPRTARDRGRRPARAARRSAQLPGRSVAQHAGDDARRTRGTPGPPCAVGDRQRLERAARRRRSATPTRAAASGPDDLLERDPRAPSVTFSKSVHVPIAVRSQVASPAGPASGRRAPAPRHGPRPHASARDASVQQRAEDVDEDRPDRR